MSAAFPFKPRQHYLGPDGLRLAAEGTRLHCTLSEDLCDLPPHRARRLIAQFVMRQALRGYRNSERGLSQA